MTCFFTFSLHASLLCLQVYVGSNDGSLYAVSATGSKVWQFSTAAKDDATGWVVAAGAVTSSPAVVTDGAAATTVYVGAENGYFFAVDDATGGLKWRFKTDGAIHSSPAVASDGLSLYFGSADMHLYAVSHTWALKVRPSPTHCAPEPYELCARALRAPARPHRVGHAPTSTSL